MLDIREIAQAVEPPLAAAHAKTWELLRLDSIYEADRARSDLFAAAMRENCAWHHDRNPLYRRYCERHSFHPELLRTADDLDRIPALSAEVFKHHDLSTGREAGLLALSSSGTSGRPTAAPLDAETLLRMWAMGSATAAAEGVVSRDPARHLVFAPSPAEAPGSGNPFFFTTLTRFAPSAETVYALREDRRRQLRLDTETVANALRRFAESGDPVRLVGLPALIARVASDLACDGIALGERTLVLTGGGWKRDAAAGAGKPELRALLERAWKIPAERVRDLYGMTEHAVHYLECVRHRFHAPVFSRVRIVDPLTRRTAPDGEEGVVHLMCPAFTTMPFQSLITADIGRAVSRCDCGRRTPAFEVRGRGGRPRYRGCAATTIERVRT